MKLTSKIIISGKIKLLTGLHIGGSKADLDIGGIDLNVIKSPHGIPFIPGSSLKGKLRSLLAKAEGSLNVEKDSDDIKAIFGDTGDDKKREGFTRLIVRDAELDVKHFDKRFEEFKDDMETPYTVAKYENRINRLTGTAEHPRQLERVPAGAYFDFEIILDVYDCDTDKNYLDKVKLAMAMLELDYLGGQGSRGYGKVQFIKEGVKNEKKTLFRGYELKTIKIDDLVPKAKQQ